MMYDDDPVEIVLLLQWIQYYWANSQWIKLQHAPQSEPEAFETSWARLVIQPRRSRGNYNLDTPGTSALSWGLEWWWGCNVNSYALIWKQNCVISMVITYRSLWEEGVKMSIDQNRCLCESSSICLIFLSIFLVLPMDMSSFFYSLPSTKHL